ncbi:WD40 repeat [Trinorchestia longiramus]|nr:WD40 repeat [Trinorchestia longiramus]
MTEVFQFGVEPITCHAWNKERTKVALSLNDNEVNIYARQVGTGDWILEHTLSGHDLRVTGVDWAPNTNRIVTCSAVRPLWSLLKVRPLWSLLKVRPLWSLLKVRPLVSPQENKFAVGSGARLISVCYFEQENNWWVSKHIKKPIRSTITTLDWHPNNILLAAGSSDFKVRIFSAWIKDIEPKPTATPWGTKMPLGQLMTEFSNSTGGGGWVHGVSFSWDGNRVCWVGHDSSVSVADASREMAKTQLKTPHLPFTAVTWISKNSLLAAGHGCCPMVYAVEDSGKLTFVSKLDIAQKKESSNMSTEDTPDRYASSLRVFVPVMLPSCSTLACDCVLARNSI